MANCTVCSKELSFLNTPTLGFGKLSDGGVLCISCFGKVNAMDSKVALSLKKHTLSEVQELINSKMALDDQKKVRIEDIKKQIQGLKINGVAKFLGQREISELPNILSNSETIDDLVQGKFNNGQGILVSTDRRLLFVDKGLVFGLKVEDFPLDKITSIQYETGLIFGSIKIHTSGNVTKIENVEKAAARRFAEFVREKLSQPKTNISASPVPTPNANVNVLEQIEKLAKMRDGGILTEEEFAEQKKKLLEKL